MPERCPDDWSGGGGEVAGFHQARFIGGAAGLDAEAKRIGHRDGVGGLGNRGVQEHGVVTKLQRVGRMRRPTGSRS